MDEYGDVLYNLYGSTEASWIRIATPSDLRRHPDTAGTPPLGTVVAARCRRCRGARRDGRIFCGNARWSSRATRRGSRRSSSTGWSPRGTWGIVPTGSISSTVGTTMVISGGENILRGRRPARSSGPAVLPYWSRRAPIPTSPAASGVHRARAGCRTVGRRRARSGARSQRPVEYVPRRSSSMSCPQHDRQDPHPGAPGPLRLTRARGGMRVRSHFNPVRRPRVAWAGRVPISQPSS